MKTLSQTPNSTPWRYYDRRQSHAEQFHKYVKFEEFRQRDSLKRDSDEINLSVLIISLLVSGSALAYIAWRMWQVWIG